MRDTWPKFTLDKLCSMEKGVSPTLKTLPGPYPLVVTAEFRRSADSWQIEGPAVCIPLISSTGHGDAALHRVHYQDGKFALANLLVALIPKDPSICNAKYLYHLLMAQKDALLVPLMQGTANVSLKVKDIAKVEIPLPSLVEQLRIVSRIEELTVRIMEARGLRRQAVDESEALMVSEELKLWPSDCLKGAPNLQDVSVYLSRGRQSEQGRSNHYLAKTQHVQMGRYIRTNSTLAPHIAEKVAPDAIVREKDILIACSAAGCLGRVAFYQGESDRIRAMGSGLDNLTFHQIIKLSSPEHPAGIFKYIFRYEGRKYPLLSFNILKMMRQRWRPRALIA